jgi:hypothetical protein
MNLLTFPDRILLSLLAATDAVFIPDRDPLRRNRHALLWERRKYFDQRGIPWASKLVDAGNSESGRKQAQRGIEQLTRARMVEVFRPNHSKTQGIRLTSSGDQYTRALAGLPTLLSSLSLLPKLRELSDSDAARPFLGRTWVPETALTGVRWGDNDQRHKYVDLEEQLLPALVRGWVVSNCSIRGHCWYSLVEGAPPMAVPAKYPEKTDEARAEYYRRIHEEISALMVATPENDREIGQIPMPVRPERRLPEQTTHSSRP